MVMDFSKKQTNESTELEFEKVEQIAILSKNGKGWTIELNRVSYNGRPPVLDLRSWSPEGRMGKGMTLPDQIAENLFLTLQALYNNKEELEQEEEKAEVRVAEAVENAEIPLHSEPDPKVNENTVWMPGNVEL
jgi:hypothetical protein